MAIASVSKKSRNGQLSNPSQRITDKEAAVEVPVKQPEILSMQVNSTDFTF